MATTTRVPLSRRYEAHGLTTAAALVRPPTGGLYLDHGEPCESQRSPEGAQIILENREAIRAYVEACVAFEGGAEPAAILMQLDIADIRAVKGAVLDFFRRSEPSGGSSTSSPSAPDGAPPTSSD